MAKPPAIEQALIGWEPRRVRAAFGAGGVAHLSHTALTVRALGGIRTLRDLPLAAPRGLCRLADDSLVVLEDVDGTPRVHHVSQAEVRTFPAPNLSPLNSGGHTLAADPGSRDGFWMFGSARQTASRMSLRMLVGSLTLEAFVTLERIDSGPLCVLPNGDLGFVQLGDLYRVGREDPHPLVRVPGLDHRVLRLVGSKPDQAYAAIDGGKVLRLDIGARAVTTTELTSMQGDVFDLAVGGNVLAAIQLVQTNDTARYVLVVMGLTGERRFERPLPWADRSTSVVVSPRADAVAVANADRISVWDASTGNQRM